MSTGKELWDTLLGTEIYSGLQTFTFLWNKSTSSSEWLLHRWHWNFLASQSEALASFLPLLELIASGPVHLKRNKRWGGTYTLFSVFKYKDPHPHSPTSSRLMYLSNAPQSQTLDLLESLAPKWNRVRPLDSVPDLHVLDLWTQPASWDLNLRSSQYSH